MFKNVHFKTPFVHFNSFNILFFSLSKTFASNKHCMKLTKLSFLVLLISGIAFTMGSCSKSSSSSSDLTGDWARASEFEGVGRTEAVTFTIGDKIYVGGGYDGEDRLNDFWEFTQSTGTWKPLASFPGTARNSAVAFAINGKGYVGTGYDGLNKLKDFWEYDPASDKWTKIADFEGSARYGAVAFSIGSYGYVSTGYDGNYLKDLWRYDPSSNTWEQMASLTGSKRTDAVAFVYSNKAYVVTGVNNGSYLNDFWVYDPAANSWVEKRKITSSSDESYDDDYGSNITRSNAVIFLMNNKAYLTTGTRSGVLGTTWEYDIANDLWAEKTAFEATAREGALAFTVGGKGFVTTGNNSSSRFDDLWQFLPDNEQSDDNN